MICLEIIYCYCYFVVIVIAVLSTEAQISFVYNVNNSGPKTEPCGTPVFYLKTTDFNAVASSHCVQPER